MMDIVSKALSLPIPLTKEYILSLPRIPKDYKIPKRVCRDVKLNSNATNAEKAALNTDETFTKMCTNGMNGGGGEETTMLIIILLLCCCCCCCMSSMGTGGYTLWKRRQSKKK
jgi:hypothetical protein|tara:strand:+ start:337 stop:675 length:339 start_codon:yes stop_codon:yes gene_type:complete